MTEGAGRFAVRRLLPADAPAFRALRLEALEHHPEAFGASLEEEAAADNAFFATRLAGNAIFGGSLPGAPQLGGIMALAIPSSPKSRHKALLWGVYLRPEARRSGLAAALLEAVLNHARGQAEEVRLAVTAGNTAARRLYLRAGFTDWGMEPRAVKIGGTYYDEHQMVLRL